MKLRYSFFVSIVVMLIFVPMIYADDGWTLLHKGKGADSDVYYKKDSIKKIDNNVSEVFIYWCNAPNKCAIQQMRIDSRNKKVAIGQSDIYINDIKSQELNFSNAGWIWFPPKNKVDEKLIKLVSNNNKNNNK